MSDTDSAVLPYPLPSNLVGKGLGEMKLVHQIKEGIFIKKKLYCIIDSEGNEIIKSSGIDSSRLNYNHFIKLLSGESITIVRKRFNVDWNDLSVKNVKSNINVHGLIENVKTINNIKDSNLRFISFPVKYNIIPHPLYFIKDTQPVKIKNKK